MKLLPWIFLLCAAAGFAPAASATEVVSVRQMPDGTFVATLSGAWAPCSYAFTAAPPALSTVGSDYQVSSQLTLLGCPSIPGAAPIPHSISVVLGAVADGAHKVTWLFPSSSLPDASTVFVVAGGTLASGGAPVPALGPQALIVLALSMLGAAYVVGFRSGPGRAK